MASNETRNKIMDTAIEMFNNGSVSGTSTVQIANLMGIRPSNIYYYFDNKEHLVRDIWSERISLHAGALFNNSDIMVSENGILNFFFSFARFSQKYSFFYRELYVLLSNDPELQQMFTERAALLTNVLLGFTETWMEIGIMHPISLVERTSLVETSWTLAQTWVAYSTITKPDESIESIAVDAAFHSYMVLRPYFTNEANTRILKLFKMSEYMSNTPLAQKFISLLDT